MGKKSRILELESQIRELKARIMLLEAYVHALPRTYPDWTPLVPSVTYKTTTTDTTQ